MPRDVFISYAHEDQAIADKVRETLEAADVKCWISSRDELPGEDWAEMIVRGMDESKIIVFIHSARSNDSDACAQELAIAHEKRKFIIPVRVENVELSRRLQYRLAGRQRIDALTPPIEAHLDKLIDAARGYIKRINTEDKSASVQPNVNVISVSQQDITKDQASQKSQQAQVWIEKATQLCTLSLYPDALKCYDKAIEINSHDAEILNAKGLLLTELDRHEEALRCFEQAVSLDPACLGVLKNKGKSLQKLQRFEEAVKSFSDALDVDPVDAETRALKSSALLKLNRVDEALVCCEAAAKLEPNNPTFWYGTAMCYARQDRYEESLENLNKALEIDSDNVNALRQKGNILSILGRDEEAIKIFDAALAIDSKSADTWYAKGVSLAKLGAQAEALMCYEEALNIDPADDRALQQQAILRKHFAIRELMDIGSKLATEGNHEEAIKCYTQVLEIDPNDEGALQQKAISDELLAVHKMIEHGNKLAAEGRHKEAINQYDKVIKRDPRNVEALYGKGIAFSGLDNLTQAIQCFDDVLVLDPQHDGAAEEKEGVKRKLKKKEEAEHQAAADVSTSNQQIDVKRATISQVVQHSRQGSLKQAPKTTQQPPAVEAILSPAPKVSSLNPAKQESPAATAPKAEQSEGQFRPTPEQAAEFTKRGIEFQSKGNLGNARIYFEKALTNDLQCYDSTNPVLAARYSNLGTVLRAMGDLTGARANFEKALAIDESSYGKESQAVAKHCNNLGMVCHAQGDLDIAWDYYKQALAIYRKSLGDNSPRAEAVRSNIRLLSTALEARHKETQPVKDSR